VRHLGEAEGRNEQRPAIVAQELEAGAVVLVGFVDVGEQRARVD
jgi:hypothetical protein